MMKCKKFMLLWNSILCNPALICEINYEGAKKEELQG